MTAISDIVWTTGRAEDFAGFDTETTSTAVESARIVEATFHSYGCEPVTLLVNPGIPIPAEASAVHGITDEKAKDGVSPITALRNIGNLIDDLWARGRPLIGHNIVFDLTILDREFRRHFGPREGLDVAGPVIDSLVLDKAVDPFRRGSRKLADVARHWGVPVLEEDLHTSGGDVKLAVRTAMAILRTGAYNGSSRLAEFPLDFLHDWQVHQYAQQRASFNSWLRGQGRVPDDENTIWPLKPWKEGK